MCIRDSPYVNVALFWNRHLCTLKYSHCALGRLCLALYHPLDLLFFGPHPLSHCLSPVRNPEYTYFWKFPKMLTTVCFPPEVFDVRSPDVALRHPPELVSVPACADHLRTKCTLFSNTGLDEHWPLAGGCSSSYRRRQGGRCRSPHSSALPASGGFAQCAAMRGATCQYPDVSWLALSETLQLHILSIKKGLFAGITLLDQ